MKSKSDNISREVKWLKYPPTGRDTGYTNLEEWQLSYPVHDTSRKVNLHTSRKVNLPLGPLTAIFPIQGYSENCER